MVSARKKDAYWFSHDMNARQDPRIQSLRSVHGEKGSGWFWIIVEILREQLDNKFLISGKHAYAVLGREFCFTIEEARTFIQQCIEVFELLSTDGQNIWSESPVGVQGARDADAMRPQCY